MVNLERISLDQLRAWVAVVDGGSFSSAGRAIGRVQSAVSQSIATLEDDLGLKLFERQGRGVMSTAAGAALVPQVRELLNGMQHLASKAAAYSAGVEPTVRVAIDAVMPPSVAVGIGRELCAALPEVAFHLVTDVMQGVVQRVQRRQADLGVIGPAPEVPAELQRLGLGAIEIVPVVGAAHPLAAAPEPEFHDVGPHLQIVLTERDGSHTPDQQVYSARTWRVDSLAAKQALIEAGLGWGNLPVAMANPSLSAGRLTRIRVRARSVQDNSLSLSAILRRDHPQGPATTCAQEALRKLCVSATDESA